MYIHRAITDNFFKLLDFFPVLAITGPRQAGKTTFAKHIQKKLKKSSLYLDLELPEDNNRLHYPQYYLQHNEDKCIIIDEIQRMPELFPILRALTDQKREPGRFILLGSASPGLIRESTETLAGRIAYQELMPFNLTEISGKESIIDHWFKGGFPDALSAPETGLTTQWLRNYVKTYIERDLPLLGLPAAPSRSGKLWTMLAHFHGSIWNAVNFSKSLGVTVPTVNRYMDFLDESFLINRLHPYHFNIKKRVVKYPKVYIRDSGILHYLTGISDFERLLGHPLIGNSWEGYVVEQIRQLTHQKYDLYFYRTHDGTESDLVLVKGSDPVCCIEVKLTLPSKLSRGFTIARNDLGTKTNFIIIQKTDDFYIKEDTLVCSLLSFLTKHLDNL